MKLIFLGSGSAFTVGSDNYNSNMVVTSADNKNLLLDCGSDIRHSSYEIGMNHSSFNAVFISHFHADHCGGLEWLGFTSKLDPACEKPTLFLKDNMLERLWNHVLSGGMSSFEGEQSKLNTFFDVYLIDDEFFTWEDITFNLVRTVHVIDDKELVPSYGLWFETDNHNIFITFDTQFLPSKYEKYYEAADIIFHDCETRARPTGVHSHYTQLITLPDEIREKIWLYHTDPGELPDAVADGFHGFVNKSQVFDLLDPKTYQNSNRKK